MGQHFLCLHSGLNFGHNHGLLNATGVNCVKVGLQQSSQFQNIGAQEYCHWSIIRSCCFNLQFNTLTSILPLPGDREPYLCWHLSLLLLSSHLLLNGTRSCCTTFWEHPMSRTTAVTHTSSTVPLPYMRLHSLYHKIMHC